MAHRMTLKNVIYGAACRRPDGTPGNSEIKYECCPTTPPPPPPPMCITQSVSDPSVCKSRSGLEDGWRSLLQVEDADPQERQGRRGLHGPDDAWL